MRRQLLDSSLLIERCASLVAATLPRKPGRMPLAGPQS